MLSLYSDNDSPTWHENIFCVSSEHFTIKGIFMYRTNLIVTLFALLGTLAGAPAYGVQRAHVASYGLDSNTSFNCDVANPCRFFQAATTVVDPNGEVVVLDSAGYGRVTLNQSISLVAPPGVYAGISVFQSTQGVFIATPGINVVLRGLTINGLGGNAGIFMPVGASLSVENCVVANFPGSGVGILAYANAARVRIVDTLLRDNGTGIQVENASAVISRATVLGSSNVGIYLYGTVVGTRTNAVVTDTTVSGGNIGFYANSGITDANVRLAIIRSTSSNNSSSGIGALSSPASTALVTLSESMVTGNNTGLSQSGAGATMQSLGNNTVRQNGINTSGAVTTATRL